MNAIIGKVIFAAVCAVSLVILIAAARLNKNEPYRWPRIEQCADLKFPPAWCDRQ